MRPIFSFLTLLLLVTSCSKTTAPARSNDLFGNWKLIVTSGGIAGTSYYPPHDSLFTLTLNSDSTFQSHINGAQTSGTFFFIEVISDPGRQDLGPALQFSTIPWPQFYHMHQDSLFLSDYLSDGYSSVYVRLH